MRILTFFLTTFIVFSSLQVAAQGANFVWAQRFGGNLNDNCRSACDQAGNVYRMDAALTKHGSNGSPIWNITPQFYALSIAFDPAGDLYIIGYFTGTIDLDHGPGTSTVTSTGGYDIAVVKLNSSNGNFIWGGTMGSSGNDFDGVIFADPTGNTYLGGSLTGTYDVDPGAGILNFTAAGTDFFVSKLNPNGNLMWAKQFIGNSTSGIGSVEVDPSGNIFFCGAFSGTVDFDPGAAVNNLSTSTATNNDMYIGKLDAIGGFLWVNQMGAAGADYVSDLEIGTNGNLYCSGIFTGLVDFDSGPGTLTLNSGTVSNAFVAEFNSSGTPNWVHNFSGFYIAAMALDQNNGICLTGQFGTADFDPGPGTFTMAANTAGSSWPDIYISKLNSQGVFAWAKQIGSVNEDGPTTISVDGLNNVHVAGRFKTTCDFDPNGGYYPLTAFGGNFNYDAFMLKLCQTPDPSVVMGRINLCEGETETYSVTPLPNATYYTWGLPFNWSGASTTSSIVVTPNNTGGNITLKTGNTCGASTTTTLQISVDICQGIKEHELFHSTLYPNPSNGTVYLETSQDQEITVFNSLGQVVHQGSVAPGKNLLELNGLPKGIYFTQLSKDPETRILKLVLQ